MPKAKHELKQPIKTGKAALPANQGNTLSQKEIAEGQKTFGDATNGRKALETKDGKNNGAIPAAFEGQQTNHP